MGRQLVVLVLFQGHNDVDGFGQILDCFSIILLPNISDMMVWMTSARYSLVLFLISVVYFISLQF